MADQPISLKSEARGAPKQPHPGGGRVSHAGESTTERYGHCQVR